MLRRLLFRVSGKLPCRLITIDNKPYLERYYMGELLGFTAYLHRFVSPDGDREVHDHPWSIAMSFVLTGSYHEECMRYMDLQESRGWRSIIRKIRWFNWIPGHRFHRIADAEPDTWTLFVHGTRAKGWGFLKLDHRQRHISTSELTGTTMVRYHQPYDVDASSGWHTTAPSGQASNRRPFKSRNNGSAK